jgi:hypothetical protein
MRSILNNFMENAPPSRDNSRSTTQEISRHLRKPKIHCRIVVFNITFDLRIRVSRPLLAVLSNQSAVVFYARTAFLKTSHNSKLTFLLAINCLVFDKKKTYSKTKIIFSSRFADIFLNKKY